MSLKEKFEQIETELVRRDAKTVKPTKMQRELKRLYKGKPEPKTEDAE